MAGEEPLLFPCNDEGRSEPVTRQPLGRLPRSDCSPINRKLLGRLRARDRPESASTTSANENATNDLRFLKRLKADWLYCLK
jgi:hypothetical protein